MGRSILERRVEDMMHELSEIRKEIILERIQNRERSKEQVSSWESLKKRVSAEWDSVSVLDEIAAQREKGGPDTHCR